MNRSVAQFIAGTGPILDVRTPAEFAKGHIKGAHNVPLFSDDERAKVGTLYKEYGRELAIKHGLDFVGPKMRSIVEQVESIAGESKSVRLHCWRGGMRSASTAWLLSLYGFEVAVLEGGYKAFRNWAIEEISKPREFVVLSGKTGAGKTPVLLELRAHNFQVVDLEGLASHRGSAFGGLGLPDQPTQQQFENELAQELAIFTTGEIWVEDEAPNIGVVRIPDGLFDQMKDAEVYVLKVSQKERVETLVEIYGSVSVEELQDSFERIEKRLGLERVRAATEFLRQGDLRGAVKLALEYYDRAYDYGLSKRATKTLHEVHSIGDLIAARPQQRKTG